MTQDNNFTEKRPDFYGVLHYGLMEKKNNKELLKLIEFECISEVANGLSHV